MSFGGTMNTGDVLETNPSVLIDIYNIWQVEYYLVPRPGKTQFVSFAVPKFPALTKAGYIKGELICYLIELEKGKTEVSFPHLPFQNTI
jgi:hypothetical protein